MTPPLPLRGFDDWRGVAKRRLPRGVFDYIDRGVGRESALARSRTRLDAYTIIPRILRGERPVSTRINLFGQPSRAPVIVAPTAMAGLIEHDGEIAMARAAARLGLPVCISTQSITPVHQIRAAVPDAQLWYQLYCWSDFSLTLGNMTAAQDSGINVLMVTVDTPSGARKDWNTRNGFGMPFTWNPRALCDIALHMPWTVRVILPHLLRGGMPAYGNYPEDKRPTLTREVEDPYLSLKMALNWEDITRLRDKWPGELVLKGVMHPQDAKKAADLGLNGIVVSSHGGRNFDPCPPAIDVLPDITATVGDRMTVLADSGVQIGTDVLKYINAGAAGVMTGRLPLWGLAAHGTAGAETALAGLLQELEESLLMSGLRFDQLPGVARFL